MSTGRKKFLDRTKRFIIRLLHVLLILILIPYFNTSIYNFPDPEPFAGEYWHNPYKGKEGDHWKVGNFHGHCQAWFGLSNGSGSNNEMYNAYFDRLGYDVLGISNYQTIDPNADLKRQVRAYEHGYSPFKYHHIVLGAKEVSWKEYPLWQSIHQKQHVLKQLRAKDSSSTIAIAHPKRGKAHSYSDIAKLTDYDCIEAFNHLSTSIKHWDAALSAGNPVYLLSDDDTHEHDFIFNTGRLATEVFLPQQDWGEEQIVQALKKGESYAIEFYTSHDETFEVHKERVVNRPYLNYIRVVQDSLAFSFSEECSSITFIGQEGNVLAKDSNTSSTFYPLKSTDTYVRIEAKTASTNHILFFNPIFRVSADGPKKRVSTVNWTGTIVYKIVVLFIICLLIYWFYRREVNYRKSNTTTVA